MDPANAPDDDGCEDFSSYAGRWIARSGKRVIAQGGTPEQARRAAQASRPKEIPQVEYIPIQGSFFFPPLLSQVAAVLPTGNPAYLVGGAVRDAMLLRPTRDLDIVVPENAIQVARKVADALHGFFYPLDVDRDYGRVILSISNSERFLIDFTPYQGLDLDTDLRTRDFTVNAMAVEIHGNPALLDPLGGANDLRNKQIRICQNDSLQKDPIRILRAVRLAFSLDFQIHPDTRHQMRSNAHLLPHSSPERIRDELLRIIDGPKPASALRAMDVLGILPEILPELGELKAVTQSPPHSSDVWDHTLGVIKSLHTLITVLSMDFNQDDAASLYLGLVSALLGRFREPLASHLSTAFTPDRGLRPLLYLAALYHDAGKPSSREIESSGRIRFFKHEQAGARIVHRRAKDLMLSKPEVDFVTTIVRHHMRPIWLVQSTGLPSRKAIYRFFRDTGSAGVDIALLSLADTLATYGPILPQDLWVRQLEAVRAFLQAWWENPHESVSPPPLVTGQDLMDELQLTPGPIIGRILEAIREAQATGSVTDKESALELGRKIKSGE